MDRKDEHIEINLRENVDSGLTNGLEKYTFQHVALPEINLKDIQLQTEFLGYSISLPLMISSMTGGTDKGGLLNSRLVEAAQEMNIAMGVGSQRAVLEDSTQGRSRIRDLAPNIPLFANLGAIQLNYGFSVVECKRAVELIDAAGLILHLNPLQEALQPEGQADFSGLLSKIEHVCSEIEVPVIVKEVGWGISAVVAKKLVDAGVSVIDVAGAGGTSWSEVEKYRNTDEAGFRISSHFVDWGIPTAKTISGIHELLPDLPIIASGGIRKGMEIAKSIALGASLAGMAGPFLKAASESTGKVIELVEEISRELRITMFAAGVRNVAELSQTPLKTVDK